MAKLDELKKELTEKELEYRNLCDTITLSGRKTADDDTKRSALKEELQHLKEQIVENDKSDSEPDWEADTPDGI